MMTPDEFVELVRTLPEGMQTVGDLLHTIDQIAHKFEDEGLWDEASAVRHKQGNLLGFIHLGIVGGAIDVRKAVDKTIERLGPEEFERQYGQ